MATGHLSDAASQILDFPIDFVAGRYLGRGDVVGLAAYNAEIP